jgi:hypothetical protein
MGGSSLNSKTATHLSYPTIPEPHFGDWKRDAAWVLKGKFYEATYSRTTVEHKSAAIPPTASPHEIRLLTRTRRPSKSQTAQVRIGAARFGDKWTERDIAKTLERANEIDRVSDREKLRPIYKRRGR